MDRVAVFIDAGYLFAQSSTLLTGAKKPRGEIDIDFDKALESFEVFARKITGLELLRIYWYDGTATGPTPQHVALAFKPRVKVRLGFVNNAGQQKGVDSLIVTDMINLARNRAMCDAILLSGDEDLRVGVQQAQEFGIRVHLIGITPCRGSQSQFLIQEADTTHEWTQKEISVFISHNPKSALASVLVNPSPPILKPAVKASSGLPKSLDEIAKIYAGEIQADLVESILAGFESTKQLSPVIDRPLLGKAKREIGTLTQAQLHELRKLFIAALKARQVTPDKPKS